jgi:hypothetical protein
MGDLKQRLEKLEIEQGRARAKMLVLDIWEGEESDQVLREHLETHPEHGCVVLTVFLRQFRPRPPGVEREAKVHSYQ